MAIQERISLRRVHRAIATVVRQLRRARRHSERSEQGRLDHLTREVENLEARTTAICGRVYGIWPPPSKTPARPPAPATPKKAPPRPKKVRKPSRPKKRR
jgi:hypothetical protein